LLMSAKVSGDIVVFVLRLLQAPVYAAPTRSLSCKRTDQSSEEGRQTGAKRARARKPQNSIVCILPWSPS